MGTGQLSVLSQAPHMLLMLLRFGTLMILHVQWGFDAGLAWINRRLTSTGAEIEHPA